jgi:hypothetical protein
VPDGAGTPDRVDLALAVALERAAVAGQWGLVEMIVRELGARRSARAGGPTGT